MKSIMARVASALGLLALVCAAALAQGGELRGTLLDEDGTAANATVTITNEATGQRITTQADGDGKFSIRQLAPGKYTVAVAAARYDQRAEVHEDKTSEVRVRLITLKSILLPYFVTMFCGAMILILLDLWLRSRGVRDPSLIWLYLTLLSWAVAKIPVLVGWQFPRVELPPWFGQQLQINAIEPDQIKYLFSIVSSLCFAWAAFQLSRVRDLFTTQEQFKRCRRIFVWWIVFPLSLLSLYLQLFSQAYGRAADLIDAFASALACLVFLVGLIYSFYRYNNWFFIGYACVTLLPFAYRQFYIAENGSPRIGIPAALSLLNTTMVVMLFIALAVAWALSDTARLKPVRISPKVYVVAMFLDLRGSTRWADEVMEGDFDCIRDFIDEVREWILSEASRPPLVCPTFVKFLGDGFMYVWEVQKDTLAARANAVAELACDLSHKYPAWVKREGVKQVLPWKAPDGLGFGVDASHAIRLTFENGSEDYMGSPVSMAAKMQNMARPTGVVVQERMWRDILDEKIADRFPQAGVMRLGDQEIKIRATKEVEL